MTEIITPGDAGRPRPKFGKAKKHPLRIDMTPMVDLGFLLITFFVFTSTWNEPKAMNLITPKDEGPQTPVKNSGVLTILPANNESVYYYEGFFDPEKIKVTTALGIRDVLVNKKSKTVAEDLFIIIKPSQFSSYKNLVDILDEMTISDIKGFALAQITDQEESSLK